MACRAPGQPVGPEEVLLGVIHREPRISSATLKTRLKLTNCLRQLLRVMPVLVLISSRSFSVPLDSFFAQHLPHEGLVKGIVALDEQRLSRGRDLDNELVKQLGRRAEPALGHVASPAAVHGVALQHRRCGAGLLQNSRAHPQDHRLAPRITVQPKAIHVLVDEGRMPHEDVQLAGHGDARTRALPQRPCRSEHCPGPAPSLLCNMLSGLVIGFLPRSEHLLISWLQSPSAVILEPNKIIRCFLGMLNLRCLLDFQFGKLRFGFQEKV